MRTVIDTDSRNDTDTGTGTGNLRLDPRYPVVWRSPSCLQIGVDHQRAVLPTVNAAEQRMLHALARGVSAEGLRMIAAASCADGRSVKRLLDRVAPALLPRGRGADDPGGVDPPPGLPLAGVVVALCGRSPARTIGRLLGDLGATVGVVADGAPPESRVDVALIVSAWFTPPAEAAVWLRRDVPHVDVVFSDTEVTIGPFVVPGAGPCLNCRERFRIDEDASWPAIAGQLLGRAAPTEVPLIIAWVVPVVASLCVAAWKEARNGGSPRGVAARDSLVLHVDGETGAVSESRQAVHPECGCRALPGTVTAREPANGRPLSLPMRGAVAGGPG